jgi:replicative DNA helicase
VFERIARAHKKPVMITSLENGPLSVVSSMVQRRVGFPLSAARTEEQKDRARRALDGIDADPVFFFDVQGMQRLSTVLDSMRYAKARCGVEYFLLDHFGYFKPEDQRMDRIQFLEDSIKEISSFAKRERVFIMLIAHPNRSSAKDKKMIPDGTTLKGTSSLEQEADLGISVFRGIDPLSGKSTEKSVALKDSSGGKVNVHMAPTTTLIYVWKKRFTKGREGMCLLEFDPRSLTYQDHDSKKTQPVVDEDDRYAGF